MCRPILILASEDLPAQCHRRLIAEYLSKHFPYLVPVHL